MLVPNNIREKMCTALAMSLLAAWPVRGAALRGIVVENGTGRPLARTEVNIEPVQGTSTDGRLHVLTDSAGHFAFSNLTAGSYHLIARRKGFVVGRYGQRGYDMPGTPVVLGEKDEYAVEMRLARLGSVAGDIHDENRVGLGEYSVYAFRLDKRIRPVASAETDDRGRFRISGLPPGRYLIGTPARVLPGNRSLLPTYFGQTTSALEARWIEVRAEEEAADVSIEPLPGQLGGVRVIAPLATRVSLLTDVGRAEVRPSPNGSFDFGGLAPGTYEVLAEGVSGDQPIAAWERVAVGGDVRTVTLQLGPAPTLQVSCRDRYDQPVPPQLVSVFLRPRESVDDPPQRLNCGETATVLPGDWTFTPFTPPNFYLADVLDVRAADGSYEFNVAPKQRRELVLNLSSRPALIRGKVLAPDGAPAIGAPVFLRALEADVAARIGPARFSQADHNGEYRFDGLAPGTYEIVASFQLKQGDLSAWRTGAGRTVTVAERQELTFEVELTSLYR
jgi:hypothetical protein